MTRRSTPTNRFRQSFSSGGAPCAGIQPGEATCPLAVSLNTFPTGTLKTPYYYQYNFGIEQQIGSRGNLRADYVGTRGLHEPYQVQLNGYQNVCNGCFAPFPYQQPLDQRFGNVTEFQTGANSIYNGLQTVYTQQWGGLTLRGNYTFSHCLDEVSNGGLLAFSTQGLESPLPGELSRQYASCDYDVRHNISAFGVYQVPFHSGNAMLRQVFGGWSFSETAFLHSGLPFSVLSQQYSANGNGVLQASNPAQTIQFAAPEYANRVPGVPLYRKTPYPGVTVTERSSGSTPMRSSRLSIRRPGHAIPAHSASRTIIQRSASSATQAATRCADRTSRIRTCTSRRLFRSGRESSCASTARCSMRSIIRILRCPARCRPACPARPIARFGTLQSTTSPPTGLLGVGLGGDTSPRMIAFQGRIEF